MVRFPPASQVASTQTTQGTTSTSQPAANSSTTQNHTYQQDTFSAHAGRVGPPPPGQIYPGGNDPAVVKSILSSYEYGPAGLKKAAEELSWYGIKCQVNSEGQYRGRLFLPPADNASAVDICGPGESMNWWDNKTGTAWGWTERGTVDTSSWVPSADEIGFFNPYDPTATADPFLAAAKKTSKSIDDEKQHNDDQQMRDDVERTRLSHIEV